MTAATGSEGNVVRAGLAGAGAMTLVSLLLRSIGGSRLSLEMMLGSLISGSISMGAWFLGLAVHLGLGVFFAALYRRVLGRLHRSGWSIGLTLGVFHAVISGLLVPLAGKVHPLVWAGALTSPAVFGLDLGWTEAAFFVVLHLLFGSIVGALCVTRRPAKPETATAPPQVAG